MALPTFVAAGSSAAGAGAVTPGDPAGAATGDILLCHIEGEGEDASADLMTDMGAWTQIATVANDTGGSAFDTRHTLHWAPWSAGLNREVADAGQHTFAIITAWRGVDTTTPIHKNQTSSDDSNNSAVSITGVTTTLPDCLIVASHTAGDNVTISGEANASLGSLTERVDVNTTQGSDGHIAVYSGTLAVAGASGTTTATQSANEREANICIALAPIPFTVITDVEGDEEFRDGDTAITITGTVFEASQGSGKVEISDNIVYATGTKIAQTVTSWADTAIDITAVLGTLAPGGPLYIWVTNDSAERNPAFSVTVHRKIAWKLSLSANIAASGEATTAQLTAPATKSTADFDAGRIQDDENPADTIDIDADDYSEWEWSIEATADAPAGDQYEFRLLAEGNPLDTYTKTPKFTVSSGAVILGASEGNNASDADGTLTRLRVFDSSEGNAANNGESPVLRATKKFNATEGNNASDGDGTLTRLVSLGASEGNNAANGESALLRATKVLNASEGNNASDGDGNLRAALVFGASEGNNASEVTTPLLRVIKAFGASEGNNASDGDAALLLALRVFGSSEGNNAADGETAVFRVTRRMPSQGRAACGTGTALDFDGTGGSATAPAVGQHFAIGGEVDVAVRLTFPDWTPGTIQFMVGQWDDSGGQGGVDMWKFELLTDGKLKFSFDPGDDEQFSLTSTLAVPATDGGTLWVRDFHEGPIGDSTFSYSFDNTDVYDDVVWIQLGDVALSDEFDVSLSSTTLSIGEDLAGNNPMTGKVRRVVIIGRDHTDFDADFTNLTQDQTSFTEDSSHATTVTINTPARILAERSILTRLRLFGSSEGNNANNGESPVLRVIKAFGATEGNNASDGDGVLRRAIAMAASEGNNAANGETAVFRVTRSLIGSGDAASDGDTAIFRAIKTFGATEGNAASDGDGTVIRLRAFGSSEGNNANDVKTPVLRVTKVLNSSEGNNASDGDGTLLRLRLFGASEGNNASDAETQVLRATKTFGATEGNAAADGDGTVRRLRIFGATEGNSANNGESVFLRATKTFGNTEGNNAADGDGVLARILTFGATEGNAANNGESPLLRVVKTFGPSEGNNVADADGFLRSLIILSSSEGNNASDGDGFLRATKTFGNTEGNNASDGDGTLKSLTVFGSSEGNSASDGDGTLGALVTFGASEGNNASIGDGTLSSTLATGLGGSVTLSILVHSATLSTLTESATLSTITEDVSLSTISEDVDLSVIEEAVTLTAIRAIV